MRLRAKRDQIDVTLQHQVTEGAQREALGIDVVFTGRVRRTLAEANTERQFETIAQVETDSLRTHDAVGLGVVLFLNSSGLYAANRHSSSLTN